MGIKEQAEAFFSQDRFAVVGVSRQKGTGKAIFDALRKRGLEVVPVNPSTSEVDGVPCYASVKEIPGGARAAVLVTRPDVTEKVVEDCAEAGVSHVWMHYNALFGAKMSSASDAAVAFCRDNGIEVIPGGCPLMFGEGADLGHRCMRWWLSFRGKLP
jgi:acyl-CoA synthetase (NDP forming)